MGAVVRHQPAVGVTYAIVRLFFYSVSPAGYAAVLLTQLDVHMHPNKFRCAWLGQGGALKVVSKGFEGAMMLGEKKIDRSKISVLPKTAKKLKFLWPDVVRHFSIDFAQWRPHDVKELDELSTFTRLYAGHGHLMHAIDPLTPQLMP